MIMNSFFRRKINIFHHKDKKRSRIVVITGILSLTAYILVQIFPSEKPLPYSDEMISAARIMEKAVSILGEYSSKSGIPIDDTIDPNRTGLIGPEFSEITTSLGHLQAKRTTTNPDMAGLIVHLLHTAGVMTGDTIAIGCSASFPALMVASLASGKAMGVYPVIIISLGASSYGATHIDFNLLDMVTLLMKEDVFNVRPAAISLGGERDVGDTWDPGTQERLMRQIQTSGIPFIYESDLRENVSKRMRIYEGSSSSDRISAFINTGGSFANMGTNALVLKVKPGLNKKLALPPEEERGALFEMAARHVPCIHLLYIRGLAIKYGLPLDPVPLPKPGKAAFYHSYRSKNSFRFFFIAVVYFLSLCSILFFGRRDRDSQIQ